LLRALELTGEILVAPFRANRAIAEASLCLGGGAGFGAAGIVHASAPIGLIAVALAIWAGLRLFEATDDIGEPIHLGKGSGRLLAAVLTSLTLTGAGGSQEMEQSEAIRDAANTAQSAQLDEAQAFADRVLELAREHREAAELTGQTQSRVAQGMEIVSPMFNLDEFNPADYGLVDQEGPVLYVLVSLGMPDEALRRYASEARQMNAAMVIRGFYGQSFADTQARIASLFTQDEAGGITIDPRPFQAFNVTRVPAIVYAQGPIEPCGELGCIPAAPPHDIVRGNMTLRAALDLFER
tara:strand:- start:3817 stop:4704 length:888 start_codon:yes stop_codon:yes gene_type:complete